MDEHTPDALRGREVSSADDEPIGEVADIDVDRRTGALRWLVVAGGRMVPADDLCVTEDDVVVPYTAEQVSSAPTVSAGDEIDGVRHRTASVHYVRSAVELQR